MSLVTKITMISKSTFRNLLLLSLMAVMGGWCVDLFAADEGEARDPFAQVDAKDDRQRH